MKDFFQSSFVGNFGKMAEFWFIKRLKNVERTIVVFCVEL